MLGQYILRLGENILNENRRHDAKRDFAINAAEGQVVDLVAERRDVRPFAGINIHDEYVLPVEIDVRRKVKRERRVAALVLSQAGAVDPHRGSGHDAFKIHEDATAAGLGRKFEAPPVAGDELVGLLVKAVPRQPEVRMGHDDALKTGIIKVACVSAFHYRGAKAPVAIDGKNKAALGCVRLGCCLSEGGLSHGRARDEGAGGLEKVTSVHWFFRVKYSSRGVHYLISGRSCKRLHYSRVGRTRLSAALELTLTFTPLPPLLPPLPAPSRN